jgi:hypothetical protein
MLHAPGLARLKPRAPGQGRTRGGPALSSGGLLGSSARGAAAAIGDAAGFAAGLAAGFAAAGLAAAGWALAFLAGGGVAAAA